MKSLVNLCATILMLPAVLTYWLGSKVSSPQSIFPGWSQAISFLPGMTGVYMRRAFYRLVLPKCDKDACISFGTVLSHPTACIGKMVYVGPFCTLGDVTLEDDVLLASGVSVPNGSRQHGIERLDIPVREQPGEWPRITIGTDSWIGDRAVVLADVGQHCVVGAGSVVTKSLPDYAIAAGVPARIIGDRRDLARSVSRKENGTAKVDLSLTGSERQFP